MANTLVPKVLLGEGVFLSPNENFHNLYYPDVMDFSMDYSLGAEGYQNFGAFGVVLAYFTLGLVIANSNKILSVNSRSLWFLLHLNLFNFGMWSIRSDSNTFFKMVFYVSVVLIVAYMVSKVSFSRVARARRPERTTVNFAQRSRTRAVSGNTVST
jgi:hypothetical protein